MSDELRDRIISAGVSLAHQARASGIVLVWAEHLRGAIKISDRIETWAVDGKGVWINPTWSADLTLQQIQFLICHETLHIALDHLGLAVELGIARDGHVLPGQEENAQLLGVAEDAIINDVLIRDGLGQFPEHKGGVRLSDFRSEGYEGPASTVELYFWLKEQQQPSPQDQEEQEDDQGDEEEQSASGQGQGDAKSDQGDQDQGDQGTGAQQPSQEAKNSKPALSGCAPLQAPGKPDDDGQIRKPMGQATVAAIKATIAERAAGSGSYLENVFTNPSQKRTSYRDVVRSGFSRASMNALNRTLPSYSRASRRIGIDSSITMPGRVGTESRIAFIADISGSMVEMFPRIVADILSVAQEFPAAKIFLVTHTDRVVGSTWLKSASDVASIASVMTESGGTDFFPAYEHTRNTEREKGKFDVMIHFTDGQNGAPSWPVPPGKQAIIALTAGENHTPLPQNVRALFVS